MRRLPDLALLLLGMALAAGRLNALILLGREHPDDNTQAPAGDLADCGWQHAVFFDFTGTVVGPRHILTAAHLGVTTNAVARIDGLAHRIVGVTNLAGCDLSLLTVAGRFSTWAPLYARGNEIGRKAVLVGRGLPRGAPLRLDPDDPTTLRGWHWGTIDFRPRWGTNLVAGAFPAGTAAAGAMLTTVFQNDGGADTAAVTGGDSGGGLFVRDRDEIWKLAGVAFSVQAQFNTGTEGDGFFAAVFDRRGLFELDGRDVWVPAPSAEQQPGSTSFHTRVSTYAVTLEAWLAAGTAEPVRLLSAPSPGGPYTEHPSYATEPLAREITVLAGEGRRFFRVQGSDSAAAAPSEAGRILIRY